MAKNLTEKLKDNLAQTITDFYLAMKDDLEFTKADYRYHFSRLGELLFQIDKCGTLADLMDLYNSGELDICGVSFDDYVYDFVKSLDEK